MKNEIEFEKLLLLKSSGELDAGQTRRLEELLESDPGMRKTDGQNEVLMRLARVDPALCEMKPEVRDSILQAAQRADRHRPRRARSVISIADWRPALVAAAAALILLAGGTLFLLDQRPDKGAALTVNSLPSWQSEIDAELLRLDQMVTSALLEFAEYCDQSRDTEALASELLRMEEMNI